MSFDASVATGTLPLFAESSLPAPRVPDPQHVERLVLDYLDAVSGREPGPARVRFDRSLTPRSLEEAQRLALLSRAGRETRPRIQPQDAYRRVVLLLRERFSAKQCALMLRRFNRADASALARRLEPWYTEALKLRVEGDFVGKRAQAQTGDDTIEVRAFAKQIFPRQLTVRLQVGNPRPRAAYFVGVRVYLAVTGYETRHSLFGTAAASAETLPACEWFLFLRGLSPESAVDRSVATIDLDDLLKKHFSRDAMDQRIFTLSLSATQA